MRILLVDDDRDLVQLLSFALRLARAGFDSIPAYDAESALRQFDECHPDLVVLDISLGASSGLDVLKELRRRSAVPVIEQRLGTARVEALVEQVLERCLNAWELVVRFVERSVLPLSCHHKSVMWS